MKLKTFLLPIAGCVLAFSWVMASATPVTYIVTGKGDGRLGTSTFSNESFTITSTANTGQIVNDSGTYKVSDLTTTISISGLGTATFITPLTTIDDQSLA